MYLTTLFAIVFALDEYVWPDHGKMPGTIKSEVDMQQGHDAERGAGICYRDCCQLIGFSCSDKCGTQHGALDSVGMTEVLTNVSI